MQTSCASSELNCLLYGLILMCDSPSNLSKLISDAAVEELETFVSDRPHDFAGAWENTPLCTYE